MTWFAQPLRMLATAALFWQIAAATEAAPAAEPKYFRYLRAVQLTSGATGQTCATLDATVFTHAATESLNDLRLYTNSAAETPFTLTESGTQRIEVEPATVRNLGMRNGDIVFDLEMPRRPYTAVELSLSAKDFLATAKVSGSDTAGAAPVQLGSFALFDLTSQHLSRSTTLPLQESTFPELHIALHIEPSPGSRPRTFDSKIIQGASVPPSREAQTLFTTVAEITSFTRRGRETVATVHLPAHVPVERVSFALDPGFHSNFLRTVNISARPDGAQDSAALETLSGEISHVHLPPGLVQDASQADVEKLSIDSALGADLRGGATVELAVQNGDDAPLPLRSVSLEMRERRLCFDANPTVATYTLMYGDAALHAPQYDYARLFTSSANPAKASLQPEQTNPAFKPRTDTRPYTERHPELLWLALIAVVAALGTVALRNGRRQH